MDAVIARRANQRSLPDTCAECPPGDHHAGSPVGLPASELLQLVFCARRDVSAGMKRTDQKESLTP
jgi:hypothetical protein